MLFKTYLLFNCMDNDRGILSGQPSEKCWDSHAGRSFALSMALSTHKLEQYGGLPFARARGYVESRQAANTSYLCASHNWNKQRSLNFLLMKNIENINVSLSIARHLQMRFLNKCVCKQAPWNRGFITPTAFKK